MKLGAPNVFFLRGPSFAVFHNQVNQPKKDKIIKSSSFQGIRVGGLSGIFKGFDYLKGHYECPPYDDNSLRSAYHIRNLETFRLKQLRLAPPTIMLSHDWPGKAFQVGH